MSLKHKKILITAGPTWVPIDAVRVISNIASGETGVLLAEKLSSLGAKVTLLLGPVPFVGTAQCAVPMDTRDLKVIRFKFFDELKQLLAKELKSARFDAVIHNAAVSDYRPDKKYPVKINSGIKKLQIGLVPTEKIIDSIKKIDRSVYLVGFKYHPGVSTSALIKEAQALIRHSRADLVVANAVMKNRYRAYLVQAGACSGPLISRAALAQRLAIILGDNLCRN